MSLTDAPGQDPHGADYWNELIPEDEAAEFYNWKTRTLQSRRQKGDGPKFIRLSSRCIRYRRADLKAYADACLRSSTVDEGEAT